jgi:integrase
VIHSLRHTYASLLIAQGESIKYVQGQLGHASAKLTLDTYGHLFPRERRTAAARLEASLRQPFAPANTLLTDEAGLGTIRPDEEQ